MVEKSGVEKFFLALGLESSWLKSSWLKSLGLKGPGLKLGVEKSRVEMSFNLFGKFPLIFIYTHSTIQKNKDSNGYTYRTYNRELRVKVISNKSPRTFDSFPFIIVKDAYIKSLD